MPSFEVEAAVPDYSESGSGSTVLALHGLTQSRRGDERTGSSFVSALEPTHRVVAYDARGHGLSTGRPEPSDYTWASLGDDLLALIDHVSPDEPVDAIGASMGCGTILHAVAKRPDRFRRLVLVIPPTAWSRRIANAEANRAAADIIDTYGIGRLIEASKNLPKPPALGDIELVPDFAVGLGASAMRGAAITDLPEPPQIARITAPTLILAWTDDPGHPLITAELLRDLIDKSEISLAVDPAQRAEWPQRAARFLS